MYRINPYLQHLSLCIASISMFKIYLCVSIVSSSIFHSPLVLCLSPSTSGQTISDSYFVKPPPSIRALLSVSTGSHSDEVGWPPGSEHRGRQRPRQPPLRHQRARRLHLKGERLTDLSVVMIPPSGERRTLHHHNSY